MQYNESILLRSDRRRTAGKSSLCVNSLSATVKRTEARKWILIRPFRRARRGEKLTRRETQENLERNSHSQFRLSKGRLNIICWILNIVLLFTHAIVLGQCAISVYICSAFSLFLPFPFIFCGSIKIIILSRGKKMRYAYRDNAVVDAARCTIQMDLPTSRLISHGNNNLPRHPHVITTQLCAYL